MNGLSRRDVLGGGAVLTLAASAARAAGLGDAIETISLWPGSPPGIASVPPTLKITDRVTGQTTHDRAITGIAAPQLVVSRPARPNGAAVLLIPGGAYRLIAYDVEGTAQARWLNAQGVTTFTLLYRLPAEGWADRADVPLQDAQRAMRLIRQQSARFGIDPARIAVIGFSAGGHLAGSIATRHGEQVYGAVDDADRLSARPDLVGMIYPVVSLAADFTHAGSRDNLLGVDSPAADRRRRSIENWVDAATPPLFLVHAADDKVVPVQNSFALYAAVLAAKRAGELHVFEEGGHGFGVRMNPALPVAAWPRLFTAYAVRKGV